MDALRWVIDNCEKLHIDPKRLVIAGDSAGGNLCASIGIMARAENIHISGLVMIYPLTTYTYDVLSLDKDGDGLLKQGEFKSPSTYYSWIENANGPFVRTLDAQWAISLYIKDKSTVLGELFCFIVAIIQNKLTMM